MTKPDVDAVAMVCADRRRRQSDETGLPQFLRSGWPSLMDVDAAAVDHLLPCHGFERKLPLPPLLEDTTEELLQLVRKWPAR